MKPRARSVLFAVVATACAVLAVAGVLLGAYLVLLGAYPAEGEGSLGHVGAVVAGVVCGFIGVVSGLLAYWAGQRARGAAAQD